MTKIKYLVMTSQKNLFALKHWRLVLLLMLCFLVSSCENTDNSSARLILTGPALLPEITSARISAGGTHTCFISESGSLYCWGGNAFGQLGIGLDESLSDADRQNLHMPSPTRVGTDSDWAFISVGYRHTCAIKTNRTLYCWGENDDGRVGDGSAIDALMPTQVGSDTDWALVNASRLNHTCAIKSDNSLYCWGNGMSGQLGDGSEQERLTPVRIGSDNDWRSVSTGLAHSCALRQNGSLWCWGSNEYGQVGSDVDGMQLTPLQIGSDTDWQSLSSGDFHACAVKSSGELWCWGRLENGRLGVGEVTSLDTNRFLLVTAELQGQIQVVGVSSPARVGEDSDWSVVGGGLAHTCGLKAETQLWCWGRGDLGAVGNGDNASQIVPVRIDLNSLRWILLTAGDDHNCAASTLNNLYCWGENRDGRVGVGNTGDYPTPTLVDLGKLE